MRTELSIDRTGIETVKGLFDIPYVNRLGEKKWTDYFSTFQPQKYGLWDSDSCWCLSGINCVEDQLEYLWKNGQFNDEAKKFFTDNGYIDSDGDFSLSERFIEILSKVRDNGSNASNFWRLVLQYGLIPRNLLTYTEQESNKWSSQDEFNNDYFKEIAVSQQMKDLGQKFLTYVHIDYEQVGHSWVTPPLNLLRSLLLQSPLQIGIPIPKIIKNWNKDFIEWDGTTTVTHEVQLYELPLDNTRKIYDQYTPNPKTLSKDYPLYFVTRGVVTSVNPPQAIPVSQSAVWSVVWRSLYQWFQSRRSLWGIFRAEASLSIRSTN